MPALRSVSFGPNCDPVVRFKDGVEDGCPLGSDEGLLDTDGFKDGVEDGCPLRDITDNFVS